MTRLAPALVASLGCVALLGSSASAEPQASRVIDRTMSCATQVRGGIRVLVAQAVTGIKESNDPLVWRQLANVNVTTGFDGRLASASAGLWTGVPGGYTFAVSSALCTVSPAKVAFSATGLTPEFVSQGGSQRRCLEPPKRVLVRVRATFRRPTSLTRDAQYRRWRTAVPIREAEVSVRTESGKPLAYARVVDDGRARLFAAPTCYPD